MTPLFLTLPLLCLLATGCASYSHSRPILATMPVSIGVERNSMSKQNPVIYGTTNAACFTATENNSSERQVMGSQQVVVGVEKTSFRSFLMLGKASAVKSDTKDPGTGYSRTVSVGAIEMAGDKEMSDSMWRGIGMAAGVAARAAAGLPPTP